MRNLEGSQSSESPRHLAMQNPKAIEKKKEIERERERETQKGVAVENEMGMRKCCWLRKI